MKDTCLWKAKESSSGLSYLTLSHFPCFSLVLAPFTFLSAPFSCLFLPVACTSDLCVCMYQSLTFSSVAELQPQESRVTLAKEFLSFVLQFSNLHDRK